MRARAASSPLRYPCTGPVATRGFGAFLERRLGVPRANLRAFARELGVRFDAPRVTLVNSGSSANLAAALALAEVAGPGAEAVIAGFTFPTTAASLLAAGFRVRVADTTRGGFCLDPAALRRSIRPSTRVIALTHFLGFPADLDAIFEIAREKKLLVLQDGCESMDLRVGERPAHARGTLTTWSFYHPHHLSAFGGGAVLATSEAWQRRVESIAHWGRACTCHVEGLVCRAPSGFDHHFSYPRAGHNLEMSELNACFGRFQLASFREQERARFARFAILHSALANVSGIRVHDLPPDCGSPFVFPITLLGRRGRAAVVARLRAGGVETRSLMGGAITDQVAYRALPDDGLPNCRGLARRSFLVGIHQTLPEADVRAVARILQEELS